MTWTFLTIIDWAIITLSLFNMITLFWLGFMVLLNTEHHRWGTWVGGGGMLIGGAFFAGHTLFVGQPIPTYSGEMEFWWRVGWLPFVSAPYFWYVLMAWYTRVTEKRLHQMWLAITGVLGVIAVSLLAFANPLPSYRDVLHSSPNLFTIGTIPAIILIYPVFSTLCIVLSLTALRCPADTERFMGDLARKRAHPWLVAAAGMLLIVSLAVGGALGWLLYSAQMNRLPTRSVRTFVLIFGFDLVIASLIALAIILIGRAVVSYEIFTGTSLPRGGLRRYWRSSLVFASSYSMLLAWCLEVEVAPVLVFVLVTILITLRFALSSWRSYVDREEAMDRLRPFVTSQRLYDHLTRSAQMPDVDATAPFHALCHNILEAEVAYLAALGPFAPLVGPPIAYSAQGTPPPALQPQSLVALAAQCASPHTICITISPADYGGAVWAVPLWSERGLIGLLLLGHKRDEGIYTQEEIEIARATGERLIDTQASAEMARRLMALQRQRLAESQVIDQRTRRELHDDVLPRLHTAMLMLSGAPPSDTKDTILDLLTQTHRQISNVLHAMPSTSVPEIARCGLIGALRKVIDSELGKAFDSVTWDIEPEAEQTLNTLAAFTAEVIFYAAREIIRNAARYGRGAHTSRSLHLTITVAYHSAAHIIIEDDGVGIHHETPPTPASPAPQGAGQGLALHSTMMAVIGGSLTIESIEGAYTRVMLEFPMDICAESPNSIE